ncbi:uncharacterized protein DC041_0011539 [Schistosoma bovis]|uniref:Apoptogenic protein 1, mitochondrial n=1 Tax=Schistosoma bovis TaxID=6184 RepID=A0A430Q2I0_SCHBO|nr:uncharacterized protein DC041_0011539 [Schistosoma bovis]
MWSYGTVFKSINSISSQSLAYGDKFIPMGYYKQLSKISVKIKESQDSKKDLSPWPCHNPNSFQYSSNIHPLRFKSKPNETNLELKYKTVCQETWRWLNEYWSLYNLSYSKVRFAKNAFLEKEKMKNLENNSTEHKIPDMGVFHREFLEANKKQRMDFNLKWYRSIVYIVYLSILVDLQQLYHRFYAKFSPKSNKCENVNDKKIKPNH